MDKTKKEIDFVKVHAGWDEIVFVYGDQLPQDREVDISLSILRKPSIRGIEVGILYPSTDSADIRIKMVDDTTQGYIPMCGGITQSIGKAIVETSIGDYFGIRTGEGINRIVLETDAGFIPIDVEVKNGTVQRVVTDMGSYLADCYKRGIGLVDIKGMGFVKVGIKPDSMEYLVLDVDELSRQYPNVNFWKREKATLDVLDHVYNTFLRREGITSDFLYGILYKMEATDPLKTVRAVFRFYPWNYAPGDELEFGCGTGTIAIGIALQKRGQISFSNETEKLAITVGGEHLSENIRVRTQLTLEGTKHRATGAWFSHDLIELVASGKIYTPVKLV